MSRAPKRQLPLSASTDSDLREDALAGQKLSAEADDESHHGEAAIPGFSERREAELAAHSVVKILNNPTVALLLLLCQMYQPSPYSLLLSRMRSDSSLDLPG